MFPSEKLRSLENVHILLWLLKDLCWVLIWKQLGLIMIIPTIALAAYLAFHSRKNLKEFSFNLAVLFWIFANSVWMIGEFFYDDGTRNIALIFFIGGLLSILFYYARFYLLVSRKKAIVTIDKKTK